jgi:acetoacetyl-CoA reductase/3-oxoacyl-[acyl-carrier protein] reductase
VSQWIAENACEEDDLALIYCIGVNYNCMIHKTESDRWEEVISSNLLGVQRVLRRIIPLMRKKKFGRIILFSSVVPQMGVMGTSAYAASKSALWGLSKAVAKENAGFGITINTLNLGYFNIGMVEDIPVKKLGDPENIFNAVEFLLKSDYITGSCIDLNGGLF